MGYASKDIRNILVAGHAGCGKTTLLRVLLGKTPADGGRFTFGTNVQIGYFDQGLGGLHPEKTVLAEIWDTYPR